MRNHSTLSTHLSRLPSKLKPKTPLNLNPLPIFTISTLIPSSNSSTPFFPAHHDFHRKRRKFAHLLQLRVPPTGPNRCYYKKIHGQMIVSGCHSDIYLTNILLNSYSKSDRLDDARQVFDKMSDRNLITWSSMLSTYTQHGCGEEALLLFTELQECCRDLYHNEFILASVVSACTQLRAVVEGAQVHCFVIKTGFDRDVFVGTCLVGFYSKNGRIEAAKMVFDDMPVKSNVTWTAIIVGYSESGRSDVALQLFNRLTESDVVPDRYVLSSVISACSALGLLESGKQIHAYVLRNGIDTDLSVTNSLIDFYAKCHKVKMSKKLFNQMDVKNVVSWTTMIAGFMQNSCDWEAMRHFFEMSRLGWRPDSFTCTSILTSCGSLRALEQGRQVHSYTIKTNLEMDDFVKNGLIDMYAKCNSLVDAKEVFDIITEHNVISYNAMIEGYASRDMLFEPLGLFQEMRLRSLHPTQLTFVSLLGLSASLSALDLSKQIHGLIVKFGVSLEIYVGSSLVDVYSKCLCTKDARNVFEGMIERDIVVWNAMVSGYTLNRQGEEALKLFLQLKFLGMKPNEFTYVALVTASSDLVSLIHGQQFHSQLIKIGLDLESYVSNALLDLYAKCGSIKDARKIFDDIPHRDVVCWNSMISRYAEHGYAQEAVDMFDLMRVEGVVPNYVTFVGVLSACSHVGLVESGLNHFESMMSMFGIEPGVEHYVSIVSLLGRAGKLDKAKEFIEQMPIEPAAIVWRSLLSACRAAGEVDMGKHAAEMAISLDPKDSGSYILLSNILASKGLWNDVEIVRQKMRGNEVLKEPGHSWI
ncbi:hypothetical protein Scep_022267 [Stephania cephalantha]|uniref:Pentatricopeptide repeat-containing protein n=1 Tax=Stephania cephalantha TaxID=152367 RepID=A0AAP0FA45_9MAGN